jgi:phage host-nuclease inhibitor protein Gam
MNTETLNEEIETAQAREEYDGRLITDDGEVIETPTEFLPVIRNETPPDEGFVKWVLRRLTEAQAQAVAAEAVVESAEAVIDDLQNAAVAKLNQNPEYVEAMARRDHAQRCAVKSYALLKRLQFYTPMLQRFAEAVTAGKKSRTWESPHGSIKLRSKPGRLKIRDEAAAVAFARKFGIDDAVKVTETFQVSKLTPDWLVNIKSQFEGFPGDPFGQEVAEVFELTPDETSVEVVTGVKVKA